MVAGRRAAREREAIVHDPPQQGAGPIWSRNYDIVTGQPIFGDKDQSIHDDVNLISIGRRNGYNWYVTQPRAAIDAYAAWRTRR